MRRGLPLTMPVAVALAVAVSACGDDSGDTATDGPATGDTATTDNGSPTAADGLVASISTVGLPNDLLYDDAPDFELWEDGTVLVEGGGPFGIDRYQLSDEGTVTALELLAELAPAADYGVTNVDDGTVTSVALSLDGEETSFTVDQLSMSVREGETLSELSSSQVEARRDLQDTLDALDDLATSDLVTEEPAPYIPETIELILRPTSSDQETPLDWPTEVPLSEQPLGWWDQLDGRPCVVIEGDDAVAVADLLEQAGPQPQPWSTGSGDAGAIEVDVRGLLPADETDCDLDAELPLEDIDAPPLRDVTLVDPADWDGQLEADSFEQASVLDLLAAAPIVAAALDEHPDAAELSEEAPESYGGDDADWTLSGYDLRLVAAEVDGARYFDLEADRERPGVDEPGGWRARIDLTEGALTTVEIDE